MINHLIIVAGGKGLRMGEKQPKQFLLLEGLPILMYTFKRFVEFDPKIKIVLGLPSDYKDLWESLCKIHNFNVDHEIVNGGVNRFDTVKNCLKIIPDNVLVGIHDGVRPFVSLKTIERCYAVAKMSGCAIPVIDVKESLRVVEGENNRSIPREKYKIVQTPQVFKADIIKQAYTKNKFDEKFTDDASVAENLGYKITLVEGNIDNIKITTKEDLLLAKELLKKKSFL